MTNKHGPRPSIAAATDKSALTQTKEAEQHREGHRVTPERIHHT